MSEATQEAVVCTGCGKSYRAKPELAGRKAKCKCGETVRFPAGAAAVVEPIESPRDEGGYDITEPVKPVAATPPPQKMTACKGCTGPMPANAVLCTRCGMNQKTGKKMGTEVKGGSPDASDVVMAAGKVALSLFLGGMTALVYAVLWLTFIYFTGWTFGIIAVGGGAAIAGVIRLINPYGSTLAGFTAAGLALMTFAIVKLGILLMFGIPVIFLFSLFDILWVVLAVSTAYRMAAGLTR